MADIKLNKNDKGFDLNFTVLKSDGAAYNLTDHTVKFHVSDKKYVTKINGDCVITDAANGLCKYTVQDGDLNLAPGHYLGELQLSTAAGKVLSNVSKMTIQVTEECG